jgi:predicted CopG family antitoxin
MRTTITLENDVAAKLKKLQEKNPNKSFKEIVNELIKKG